MVRSAIILLAFLHLPWCVPSVEAQYFCGPGRVSARSNADTIFVRHENAERNCCTQLTLRVESQQFVVDFFEGEAEPFCVCTCCFDLRYQAHDFPAGHYRVRVWDESGSVLYGEAEVDVAGPGGAPALGAMQRGDCVEIATQPETWSRVRAIYR